MGVEGRAEEDGGGRVAVRRTEEEAELLLRSFGSCEIKEGWTV
jgi:hypothetical protein